MKNTFVKVLSFMMALTMIVGAFGAITVSAADCAHENRTETAVVAPTCATAGFTSYKCNDCGASFIDGIKNATGKHTWTNVAASAATCEDPAYSAHKMCSVCETVEGKNAIGAALGHVFNIPYAQKATCTEDGFTSKECARCGKVDDRIAPAGKPASDEFGWKVVSATDKAAHKYIYTVVTAPTACTSGSIKVTCSACDYNATIAQTQDHNWKEMSSADAAAMLTKKGIVVGEKCNATYKSGKICIECGAVKDTVAAPKTHELKEVDFATVGEQDLNAEIQALGYNYGDKTSTEVATQCVTVRVYLAQCTLCKVYAKASTVLDEGKGHKWVKDGAEYYADGTPSHKEDKLQNYKCDNVLEDGTTKCSATKTEVAKAATACTYKKEGAIKVIAATCENNGYTEYKCDECGVVTKGDITYKTGHNYGAAVYKSGTCDTADDTDDGADDPDKIKYVQKCPNKGCEKPEKEATLPKDADKCTWVKVTREATCIANAYYEYECSVCKATKAYDKTDAPTAGYKPTNHVAKVVEGVVTNVDTTVGTNGLLEPNIVKQTCTTSQVNRYMCKCGVAVDLTVGAAPAHDYGDSYTDAEGNVISVAVKPATCKAEGIKTAGEICKECGTINPAKKPVVDPINPKNHKDAATATPIDSDVATCTAKGYTKKYYTCCSAIEVIETTTDKNADNHTTKGVSNIKAVAEVPATCLADGTKAHYKCSGCGKLFSDLAGTTATTAAALKITNPGNDKKHDWNTTTVTGTDGAKAETCTADGTKEYYTCKATGCLAIKIKDSGAVVEGYAKDTTASDPINKRYPDLKIAAHGTTYMGWQTGKAPTCTEDGYRFKPVTDATKYYTEAAYCCAQCDKITVGKTNHINSDFTVVNASTSADYDCTSPTYELHVCPDCGYTFFKKYVKVATDHNFDRSGDDKVDDKDYVSSLCTPANCTEAGVNVLKCVTCTVTKDVAGAAAIGHKIDVNGVKIAVDFGCTSADHETYKGKKCVCGAELGKDSDHNVVTATAKAPTCTATGNSEFDYCVDCGKITKGTVVEIPATGHSYASTLISTENGVAKYNCPDCGEYWTEEVIEVVVDAEFSSTLLTAGATFTVDIFVTADNFTFNYFEIDCYDDVDACKLVKVELTDALPATAHADFDDDGWFWIYSEHDVNGDPAFITLDGEKVKVATLTYEVSDIAYGSATFEVGPYDAVVGFDEEGNEIEANFVDTYTYVDVVVAMAGDLNGDGGIGYSDVQAVMFAVANGANDLVADVNRDGVVDVFDIAALRKFTSSDNSAYDFFVMTGVDVEAVAAKYKADMNDDGYINDSDKVLFVEFIVDVLQYEYYQDVLGGMAIAGLADLDELCAVIAIDIANNGVPTP